MITDIPTPEDFQHAGISFLHLAWDTAHDLVWQGRENYQWDYWGDEEQAYWNAAQRPLATALALAQQGIELLLKAKIAEISPFLLLDSSWCKGHDRSDTPFSELRTIDSQDLIRAHDSVQKNRLPDDFRNRVNELRRLRNSIFHTVDKRLRVTATDVMFAILDAVHYLIGPHRWIALRREALSASPTQSLEVDWHDAMIAREVAFIVDLFPPSDVFRFLGLNKRRRRYRCYFCQLSCVDFDESLECTFAVLRPNNASSTTLFCLVCNKETRVQRLACVHPGCKGNVIHSEDNVCLTCFESQDSTEDQ